MPDDYPPLTIGQVAARAGVRLSPIRCCEDVGVMPERAAGQRRYGDDVVRRLTIHSVGARR